MNAPELKLIQLIAESENAEMQKLFLEVQGKYNKQINTLADLIGLLAYNSIHIIGVEQAREIITSCNKLKAVTKPDTSINDNLTINEKP